MTPEDAAAFNAQLYSKPTWRILRLPSGLVALVRMEQWLRVTDLSPPSIGAFMLANNEDYVPRPQPVSYSIAGRRRVEHDTVDLGLDINLDDL